MIAASKHVTQDVLVRCCSVDLMKSTLRVTACVNENSQCVTILKKSIAKLTFEITECMKLNDSNICE